MLVLRISSRIFPNRGPKFKAYSLRSKKDPVPKDTKTFVADSIFDGKLGLVCQHRLDNSYLFVESVVETSDFDTYLDGLVGRDIVAVNNKVALTPTQAEQFMMEVRGKVALSVAEHTDVGVALINAATAGGTETTLAADAVAGHSTGRTDLSLGAVPPQSADSSHPPVPADGCSPTAADPPPQEDSSRKEVPPSAAVPPNTSSPNAATASSPADDSNQEKITTVVNNNDANNSADTEAVAPVLNIPVADKSSSGT